MQVSRRSVLAAAPAAALTGAPDPFAEARFQHNLERYAGFGVKATGGAGDKACGGWLEAGLVSLGYNVQRQTFQAPYFDIAKAELRSGAAVTPVIPQAVVVPTGPKGLTAPLRLAQTGADLKAAIALVVLPAKRWSTIKDPDVQTALKAAFDGGAAAAVVVTTGPSRQALALNAPADAPMFGKPVATFGPLEAEPFIAAAKAGTSATLTLAGTLGRRAAYNLIGRRKGGGQGTMIISTPRSGWFTCGAERGSGVAAWLALAAWAARSPLKCDIELLATSGHEYEYLGGEHYIAELAPKPAQVKLWVHLGANVAARDWRETPTGLAPLDTADGNRVLMASANLLEPARRAFAGQPGLAQPRLGDIENSAGELTNTLKAGYAPLIGVFGSHRFHHAKADDLRCTSAALTRQAAVAFRDVIAGVVT